jgi:hypothetical protein
MHARLATFAAAALLVVLPQLSSSIADASGITHAAASGVGPATGIGIVQSKATDGTRFTASWDAVAGADGYSAFVRTASGQIVNGDFVSDTTWTTELFEEPGTDLTFGVTPYVGDTKGTTATSGFTIAGFGDDTVPPSGSYTVSPQSGFTGFTTVTLTQTALSDDHDAASAVTRSVDWGDGGGFTSWVSGTTLTKQYATASTFTPRVKLVDTSGNSTTVSLPTVTITADTTAPTGTFAVSPRTGYQGSTPITVTQSALSDNRDAAANITRSLTWADGSGYHTWTSSAPMSKTYTLVGTHIPKVQLTDRSGNTRTIALPSVNITADSTDPTVTVTLPTTENRPKVSSWGTLRGTVSDAGSGPKRVAVKVLEKRGSYWYMWKPATQTWAKGYTSEATTRAHAGTLSITSLSGGAWSCSVQGMTVGSLSMYFTAYDQVGNSLTKPLTQTLTQ